MKKINPMRYKNGDYYFVQYWNVAIINNNGTDSFSIECRSLHYRDFKGYEGIIQFTDLRTGKRIGYYEFSSEKFDNIIINILDYMNYISGN